MKAGTSKKEYVVMDKMNYSKNIWKDDDEVLISQNNVNKVLPWRTYCSQRQAQNVMGSIPQIISNEPSPNANIFTSKKLEPKNSDNEKISHPLNRTLLGIMAILFALFSIAWFSKLNPYSSFFSKKHLKDTPTLDEYLRSQKKLSPEELWQNWKNGLTTEVGYLEHNEALVLLLKRYGLSQKHSSNLVLSVEDDLDLTRLRAEDPIQLFFNDSNRKELVGFQIGNKDKTVHAYLYNGEAKNEIEYHELRSKSFHSIVTVKRSLYQDGIDQGIPGGILLEMFNRYSFDINFQSDIQRGTRYEIIYTMIYNEKDVRVGSGEILYANIILTNGKALPIFRYTDLSGKSEFFNPEGHSVNKLLLLMPVNGAYVSSNFGYRRDPIFGTWRLHRGTDYAAPTGTPIKAGGNGRIIRRGWSRIGYGYHIIIRHINGYDTLYGHMSRFRSGYKIGSKVRQGDIIGYVGSTGKSTGPHVHYEVRRYNKPVGLKSLHLQSSRDLTGLDKQLFENNIHALQSRFKTLLPELQNINAPINLVKNKDISGKNNIGGAY